MLYRGNGMPQDTLSFMQRLQEYGLLGYAWILLIAFWGGTVRYLTAVKSGEKPTALGWITETIISGFVGVIAAMICQYFKIDYLLTSAITGIAAHNGTRTLFIISEIVQKNVPIVGVLAEHSKKKPITARRAKNDR